MPPLEAMACKVPVLTSNAASLPEVTGDCAVVCPPDDAEAISRGLESLWKDPDLRNELALKGYERAKMFTWENSAKLLYKVYEEIA